MNTISVSKKELEVTVTRAVENTMRKEFAKLRASALPYVTLVEQREIEKKHAKPTGDFVKVLRAVI